MSDAPITPYNPAQYDDEISISELLLKLWAKRDDGKTTSGGHRC